MLTDVRKLQLKYTILCYQKYVDKEVTTIKIIVHFSHTKAQPTKLECSQNNTLPPQKKKQNKTKQKRETSNIALKELVKVDCRLPVRVMWQKLNIKVIQPFVRE